VDKLLYRYHLDNEREVIDRIKTQNPSWTERDGICSRCIDYYQISIVMQQRLLPEIGPHFSVRSVDDFIILPTPLRVDTHPRFTGKGVTICFIDSGFYLHPDLIGYRNRIKAVVDINNLQQPLSYFEKPHPESWHGTMTSVVCAGDGYVSNGLYKGIAGDAELVLLKVQDESGKITTASITKAMQWVLDNHGTYQIKIVNISLGGDEVVSYRESEIDLLAEQLENAGITVVTAVGNDENGNIRPPANALHVIAVGGVDDENKPGVAASKLYHSTWGTTTDGLQKPDVTAHAIWIAAPILPRTTEHKEGAALYQLLETPADKFPTVFAQLSALTKLNNTVSAGNDVHLIKEAIKKRMSDCKYISPHYMHVDGTSFAAPIVSAVVAQLLEANPALTPAMIRQVLFSTARRMEHLPPERQGFGLIQPRRALISILKRCAVEKPPVSPVINKEKGIVSFYVHDECAQQISLAGSFNGWKEDVLLLEPRANGVWEIEIPMLPPGRYPYKFFTGEKRWIEDADNPWREPDGFNAFNSILIIEPGNSFR
jgi:serine protease AprX